MAVEAEMHPTGAGVPSRDWRALDLPPELRSAAESAAAASGLGIEAWLDRAVQLAANGAGPAAEPPSPQVLLTSEAEPAEAATELPAAEDRAWYSRNIGLIFLPLAILTGIAAGTGAFYLRYGGVPIDPRPATLVSAPLPPIAASPPPAPAAPVVEAAADPASTAADPASAVAAPEDSANNRQTETAAINPRPEATPAEPTSPTDALKLGMKYIYGDGVKQDYKRAAELFLNAAIHGLPEAKFNLGVLYDKGLGVPKDPARAVIWFRSAANQNYAGAQVSLGLAYAYGNGIARDDIEAARWFRRAAQQGEINAQYNLAAMYGKGLGVRQSFVDAQAWFGIAAAAGDAEAKVQAQRIAADMSAQELQDAKTLAAKLKRTIKPAFDPTAAPAAASSATASAGPPTGGGAAPVQAPEQAGSEEVPVAEIQQLLARLRFYWGPADGVMNARTASAIRRYQRVHGIKADGLASADLLARLEASAQQAH